MKKASAYLAAICLAALVALVVVRLSTEPSTPVFPATATKLHRIELADLVALVLPPKGFENLGWDYLANEPAIMWQTPGIAADNNESYRRGIVRVSVGGKTASVLHQVREELAWTLTLGTNGNENFGPKWISIQPGVLPDDDCFGTPYDGCTFDVRQAVASVKSTIVCGLPVPRLLDKVYSVSSADKDASLLLYQHDGGSGGEQDQLEIRPKSDQSTVCNPDADK